MLLSIARLHDLGVARTRNWDSYWWLRLLSWCLLHLEESFKVFGVGEIGAS